MPMSPTHRAIGHRGAALTTYMQSVIQYRTAHMFSWGQWYERTRPPSWSAQPALARASAALSPIVDVAMLYACLRVHHVTCHGGTRICRALSRNVRSSTPLQADRASMASCMTPGREASSGRRRSNVRCRRQYCNSYVSDSRNSFGFPLRSSIGMVHLVSIARESVRRERCA